MIRVLIVDDHALVRDGLTKILDLEDDIEVLGTAPDAAAGLAAVRTFKPDIVLLDVQLPGRSGLDALPEMIDASPATRFIILTGFSEGEYGFEALKRGARGFVLKDAASLSLVKAIHAVHEGEVWADKDLTSRLVDEFVRLSRLQTAVTSPVDNPLTNRERAILTLVAQGQTNSAIGEALFISEKTVKSHLTNVFDKLNVEDRSQAAMTAFKRGYIQISD
ncbi:MAG TPA: response regulator transcription factor [Armatimonadota bacterium]|jgi:two-component system NarL family response regulator/two-component system response regulator DegU